MTSDERLQLLATLVSDPEDIIPTGLFKRLFEYKISFIREPSIASYILRYRRFSELDQKKSLIREKFILENFSKVIPTIGTDLNWENQTCFHEDNLKLIMDFLHGEKHLKAPCLIPVTILLWLKKRNKEKLRAKKIDGLIKYFNKNVNKIDSSLSELLSFNLKVIKLLTENEKTILHSGGAFL